MGLQKYRADEAGKKQANGGTPYYSKWVGGPTLALVRECKIENVEIAPRTVYIQGEADTYFSIPAACVYRGKTITGYITSEEGSRDYVFRAHTSAKKLIAEMVPLTHAVQPLRTAHAKANAKALAHCETCDRFWDDGKSTSMTPVPSARCPFEAYHPDSE